MPIPRAEIVDYDNPGLYHCVSRCVRRAFLCGGSRGEFEHRRDWLEARLRELAGLFAIDVVAYAIMHNHLHILLWTDPARATSWSRTEVARRWLTLMPKSVPLGEDFDRAVATLARDCSRIETLRRRLCDIGWFNRALKEPLARLANQEDGCTGAFWEGRYRSYRVVDDEGALACCIYIDLNAIRAGLAKTPETSTHTSVHARAEARQRFAQATMKHSTSQCRSDHEDEETAWLIPFEPERSSKGRQHNATRHRRRLFGFGIDTYLRLVDQAGRILRNGARGAIPSNLAPIIERLDRALGGWSERMGRTFAELIGTTIGGDAGRAAEAVRRGRHWVIDPLGDGG